MSVRRSCAIVLPLVAAFAASAGPAAKKFPASKKLIEYGWDVPTPAFVREHIREMEKRPFDGVMMRLAGPQQGRVFLGGRWDEARLQADFDALVSRVYRFVSETPDRNPLTDWYQTDTGRQVNMIARPVVGGFFLQMLTSSERWQKWADKRGR